MICAIVFFVLFEFFAEVPGRFCTSQDGCRQIEFEPAHSADGKRLRNHLIRTEDVMYDDFCDVLCFMDPDCVSYNLKTASTDGKYKCELNNSTFEGEIENLEENSEYRYRGIKNVCLGKSCKGQSTCQVGFTDKGYRCSCSAGFTGPFCETDIDECDSDTTCDANEVCDNTIGSFICTCRPPYYWDGKTCEQASSCKEIYDKKISKENKAYPIEVGGQTVNIYCHMTTTSDNNACEDGGWTLVMKTDGTKQTFLYDSPFWQNNESFSLSAGETGFDKEETKLPTYWNTSFTKICLAMKNGVTDRMNFIIVNKGASSLYSLIADGQYKDSSLGRDKWISLIGSQADLQDHCNKEGFNARSTKNDRARARIGIISNDADNCDGCNSRIGFGTAGEHNHNTCGYMLRDKGIATMGYIFVH
ncbi:uncharacterized skeletal organic matrix protein 5-like isoform X2 [Montipora capricornis]|uniref:uncharacterized skeletal organic matrix protein 5-like isoform X2 n=1 Tax=Montipora capricornis TaxID=246305 RepID=UPI0035F143BE